MSTKTWIALPKLNQNIIPIYEPGLDELVACNLATGRIRFSSFLPQGVQGSRCRVPRSGYSNPSR